MAGLNGLELGDKNLKVQRASIGVAQASGLEMGVNAMSMLAGTTSDNLDEGRVLQLLNMVTPEELIDNEEYEGKKPCVQSLRMTMLNISRNLRGHQRRVFEIRRSFGDEDSTADRRQQAAEWSGKDIYQIRYARFRSQSITISGRTQICR